MVLRVEGLAIISEDGMLADANGIMPTALLIEADQRFLSERLDRAALIVHGRNSHENQPHSPQRWRLIVTRSIESIAPASNHPNALFWNPAGIALEKAADMLGVRQGTVAILGGTDVYGLFLPRYDFFHLSRRRGIRLLGGRPVFPKVPQHDPEEVLASNGLTLFSRRPLDASRGVDLFAWIRKAIEAR